MGKEIRFIAVVGSRDWKDKDFIHKELDKFEEPFILVSGGAEGADTIAEEYAEERFSENIRLFPYIIRPNYKSFGKYAPLRRNKQIAQIANYMVAFWNGKSRGTAHAIECMHSLDKTVEIFFSDGRHQWLFPSVNQQGELFEIE